MVSNHFGATPFEYPRVTFSKKASPAIRDTVEISLTLERDYFKNCPFQNLPFSDVSFSELSFFRVVIFQFCVVSDSSFRNCPF